MKKIRKLLLLASVSTLALAAPAVASAAEWTQLGQPLEETELVELDGSIEWEKIHYWGGIYCDAHALAAIGPNGSGTLETFEIDRESCQSTGQISTCEFVEAEATAPVSLTPVMKELKATATTGEVGFDFLFGGSGCPIPAFIPDYPKLTLTPDNSWIISHFSLYGMNTSGTVPMTGDFEVTPAEVFGIE